jgi:hypothetical protein
MEEIDIGEEVVDDKTVPPMLEAVHHTINNVVAQAMLSTACTLTKVHFHLPNESILWTGKQPYLNSKKNRFIRHELPDEAILTLIWNHALIDRDLPIEVVDALRHLMEHVQQPSGFSYSIESGVCHISNNIVIVHEMEAPQNLLPPA